MHSFLLDTIYGFNLLINFFSLNKMFRIFLSKFAAFEKMKINRKRIFQYDYNKMLNIQLWWGSCYVNRSERMHGSKWMFGFTMLERSVVHQFGTETPLSLRLFRWFLGRKLRIDTRRPNSETEHGRTRGYSCLPSSHFKWAHFNKLDCIYSVSKISIAIYKIKWLELYHTLEKNTTCISLYSLYQCRKCGNSSEIDSIIAFIIYPSNHFQLYSLFYHEHRILLFYFSDMKSCICCSRHDSCMNNACFSFTFVGPISVMSVVIEKSFSYQLILLGEQRPIEIDFHREKFDV